MRSLPSLRFGSPSPSHTHSLPDPACNPRPCVHLGEGQAAAGAADAQRERRVGAKPCDGGQNVLRGGARAVNRGARRTRSQQATQSAACRLHAVAQQWRRKYKQGNGASTAVALASGGGDYEAWRRP